MKVKPGIYEHYKKKLYKVIGEGKHSETLEDLVFYIQLETNTLWVRPTSMFIENVIVEGKSVPRFKYISDKL